MQIHSISIALVILASITHLKGDASLLEVPIKGGIILTQVQREEKWTETEDGLTVQNYYHIPKDAETLTMPHATALRFVRSLKPSREIDFPMSGWIGGFTISSDSGKHTHMVEMWETHAVVTPIAKRGMEIIVTGAADEFRWTQFIELFRASAHLHIDWHTGEKRIQQDRDFWK